MKNDIIVIGYNHFNPLNVVRSLGKNGFRTTLIIVEPNARGSFVQHSKYVYRFDLVRSVSEIFQCLDSYQFEYRVPIITCADVCALEIDKKYDKLIKKYIVSSCHSRQEGISFWMDKSRMLDLAKEVGFDVPFTLKYNIGDTLDYDNIPFPCLIKPCNSSEGKKTDFRICENITEFKNEIMALNKDCQKYLIQELIKKDQEVLVLGANDFDNKTHFIPGSIKKLKTCTASFDMGMNCFSYISDDEAIDSYLHSKIVDFINRIEYDGIYSMEFLLSGDKIYFLEVNLRTDGCIFICDGANVSIPSLWVQSKYGIKFGNLALKKKRIYGMTEISYIKYLDWIHPLKWLRDFSRVDVFSIFSWNDVKPFLFKFIYP